MRNSFTPTEVGLLVESLRSEFRLVGEQVVSLLPLREDVAQLKEEVREVRSHLELLEIAVRLEVPAIKTRLSQLETKS